MAASYVELDSSKALDIGQELTKAENQMTVYWERTSGTSFGVYTPFQQSLTAEEFANTETSSFCPNKLSFGNFQFVKDQPLQNLLMLL